MPMHYAYNFLNQWKEGNCFIFLLEMVKMYVVVFMPGRLHCGLLKSITDRVIEAKLGTALIIIYQMFNTDLIISYTGYVTKSITERMFCL